MSYKRRITGTDWLAPEDAAMFNGYDFNGKGQISFWNSFCDDLFFETDTDGHCLTSGICYGPRHDVTVWIEPPKPSVETVRLIMHKIAAERFKERRHQGTNGHVARNNFIDPSLDDVFYDLDGNVQVAITGGVPDELARVLLCKIADRMEEIPSLRHWHGYGLRRLEMLEQNAAH